MDFIPRSAEYAPIPADGAQMPDWIAQILSQRGIRDAGEAKHFLKPSADGLLPPEKLPGMHALCAAVRRLLEEKAGALRVTVFGDYDVDGVCACITMVRCFRCLGVEARIRLPDRHREGYGLSMTAVEEMIGNTDLLLTVDCGITSTQEVRRAREAGICVIVTDHHTPGEELPDADAVVDPMLSGEGYSPLCGAGVALKVMWALCGWEQAEKCLQLCALATVADLVPLTGENRILVALGLRQINAFPEPGIRALMRTARVGQDGEVTSETIAYQLAPRLNAAGRLASAEHSVELLSQDDESLAMQTADVLEGLNRERRTREDSVIRQARSQVLAMELWSRRSIVAVGEDWDPGVVGLAAGKLAEEFAYPTVCLTRSRDGQYQGSGRSAGGIDLYGALKECADLLSRFGGHRQAAGLSLRAEDLTAFTGAFDTAVRRQLGEEDLRKQVFYDLKLSLRAVDTDHLRWLKLLEPYGMGNPRPTFLFEDCGADFMAVGAEGRHLRCRFDRDGVIRPGIWFSHGELAKRPPGRVDFVAEMSLNRYQGKETAQCMLRGLRPARNAWREDPEQEEEDCLRDLKEILLCPVQAAPGGMLTEKPWQEVSHASRGTLYLCRRARTMNEVLDAFPSLEPVTEPAEGKHAYSAAALGLSPGRIPPGYGTLVLCDGTLGEAETDRLRQCCLELIIAPEEGARIIRERLCLEKDRMRRVYEALRGWNGFDREDLLAAAGVTGPRLMGCLYALQEKGLIRILGEAPLRAQVVPREQWPPERDPEKTAWYTLIRTGRLPAADPTDA